MLFSPQNGEYLPVCHSTNEELHLRLDAQGIRLPEGYAIRAGFQTGGKGQKGSVWESAANENLLYSFLLRPGFLEAQHNFWLSATVALAICETLQQQFGLQARVKWPNDILIGTLKICGILIENVISGTRMETSIVGIGLNVNQTKLPSGATSLAEELGYSLEVESVFEKVNQHVNIWYARLAEWGWEKVRSKYHQNLYKAGMVHQFTLPSGEWLKAIVKGVSPDGRLVLICSDGERLFDLKQIRF